MFEGMKLLAAAALMISLGVAGLGCGSESEQESGPSNTSGGSGEPETTGGMEDDHDHGEEVALGTATVGDLEVEAFQGHGETEPGKEMHLVVKLPYNDSGASEVRAWIGTEDRFASVVGKGEYASSHDDYDIHAVAPDPLPEGAAWWIEVTQPDGSTHVGSIDLR